MLLGFEIGQRWPEAVMHSCGSYFVPVPNRTGRKSVNYKMEDVEVRIQKSGVRSQESGVRRGRTRTG
jgi:hypothetical protein